MNKQSFAKDLLQFFLVKIIIGIAVVGGAVVLAEWAARGLLNKTHLDDSLKNVVMAFLDSAMAIAAYVLLFRNYEKRNLSELSLSTLGKNAVTGFGIGLILQSLFIFVIWLGGGYTIIKMNTASSLILPFTTAFTAGFVTELLIRGVFFRLIEEKLGTSIALILLTVLFGLLHINVKGATVISIAATALQAGFVLSAVYVFSRSLWLSIFLHFAWDFAEPGIYGAINPGNSIDQSLFISKLTGSPYLTGGSMGPQNSVQAIIFCSITGFLFVLLARRRMKWLLPYWQNKLSSQSKYL